MTNQDVTESGGWAVYRAVDDVVFRAVDWDVYVVVLQIVYENGIQAVNEAVGDFEASLEVFPHPGLGLYLRGVG